MAAYTRNVQTEANPGMKMKMEKLTAWHTGRIARKSASNSSISAQYQRVYLQIRRLLK